MITAAHVFVSQVKKNCPDLRMTRDEEIELARLFSVAQTEAANHGREMVIEKFRQEAER